MDGQTDSASKVGALLQTTATALTPYQAKDSLHRHQSTGAKLNHFCIDKQV